MSRRASVGSVLLGVLAAALLVLASYEGLPSAHSIYPRPPPGWVTFDQAQARVAEEVAPNVTGPWTLDFAEGVAADQPWSPEAWQWGGPLPGALCGLGPRDLLGVSTVTFWNASLYPFSTDPNALASGAAPLWTFAYLNTSGTRVFASWFEGSVVLNGLIAANATCSLNETKTDQPILPTVQMDSDAAVYYALNSPAGPTLSGGFYHSVLLFPGTTLLDFRTGIGGRIPEWQVVWTSCGDPSYHGLSNLIDVTLNATTYAPASSHWTIGGGGPACYDTSFSVGLNLTRTFITTSPAGVYFESNITSTSVFTSHVPPSALTSDLVTDLVTVQVERGYGPPPPPPVAALCTDSNPGFSNCTPPSTGWYAVLLDANGAWLDSFPSHLGGGNWTVSGVQLSVGDLLVIVSAQSAFEGTWLGLYAAQDNPFVFGSDWLQPP